MRTGDPYGAWNDLPKEEDVKAETMLDDAVERGAVVICDKCLRPIPIDPMHLIVYGENDGKYRCWKCGHAQELKEES